MLKIEEIRALAPDEMTQKVETLKKELLTLRIELRMGKLEKHNRIRDTRKAIARLLTVFRETEQVTPRPEKAAKPAKKEVKVKKEAEKKVEKAAPKKQTPKPEAKKSEKVKKGKS